MIIWRTPVTATQFFGYGIALSGLIYYKLGAESLRQYASDAGRSWADFGARKPAIRKAVVFLAVLLTTLALVGGLGPTFAPERAKTLKDMLGGYGLGS